MGTRTVPQRRPLPPRTRSGGGILGFAVAVGAALYLTHGGLSVPAGAVTDASVSSDAALGQQMAAERGWTGTQWTCLNELWTEESGWDADAANPTSDARGIPQNISGWSLGYMPGNAGQQITWGLDYIGGRYGTPCAAWGHEKSTSPNWY